MKICKVCGGEYPVTTFRWKNKAKTKRDTKCTDCYNAWRRARWAENPESKRARQNTYRRENIERWRHYHLRAKYGISAAEYDALFEAQGGVCACCGELPGTRPGKSPILVVDHDHDTNEIRGLICSHCNCMIGYALDTPERLEQGAAYLRRLKDHAHAADQSPQRRPPP